MKTSTFLWRLIRYEPGRYSLNALMWTLISLAPVIPGLLTKEFFDFLDGQASLGIGIGGLIALLVGAALARVMLIFMGFITDVHYRFRMGMLLRRNLLEHILKEPGARAIPVSPGEAISHFRDDVDQTEEAVSWSVDVLGMLVFAGVSAYILLRIDAQITMLVFLPLVVVVTAAQLATSRLQRYRAASREATSQVTGAISEMFGNVQAIQVAGAEARVIERFRNLSDRRRKTMLKDRLMTEALDSVFSNTVHIGTGLILLLAAYKMRAGTFSIGDFALFVYYLNFVTQFITNVGRFLTYFKQMEVALRRLTSLLQGAPAWVLTLFKPLYLGKRETPPARAGAGVGQGKSTPSGSGEQVARSAGEFGSASGQQARRTTEAADQAEAGSPAAIATGMRGARQAEPEPLSHSAEGSQTELGPLRQLTATGLTYRYPETGRGIENISLELERGSFTVITGMVGAGKTTLVRAVLGLLPLEAGEIRWNGVLVEDPGSFFMPPRSAYASQVPRLYSDTLNNNIMLGEEDVGGRLQAAVHTAVLERDIGQLEQGLQTTIGPRGVKLSGGQAQRTAAARMLARQAELYVFDDVSSALDVETERQLWERLFRERREATCLVVSHRRVALSHASHIIVMKDGFIESQGTAEALLQQSELFRQIWQGDAHEG
ncbi:ABC transporter ATP-binding protein [Paenibacillus daejeonensis]|uniref:ABC transporter ATP-binding protein n=1 Tax=Paenibacillus daejeonensis TaxID=135193 RepID=UPI000366433D|nr:ABC transporter ATP-binding protein [Paenibacillus daejeonensis]